MIRTLAMRGKEWRTLSSKVVYKNPFMRVRKDQVMRHNGVVAHFYVLDRPSSFSIIVPLENNFRTYLVGQYRYPTKYYSWEFPMGGVVGLTSLEMAKQELKEETGLTAKKWEEIGRFQLAPGHCSQEAYVFVAWDLKEGDPEPEDNEFLEIKKIPIKKMGEMINKGQILDGPTIVAYHFLERFLKE